jgi:adenylate kinase family enzyme
MEESEKEVEMSYYIIIRGPLGIGKSTIAEALAKDINARYIAIDRIVDNPRLITQETEEGYISQKNFIQANGIAVERVKKDLENKKSVVFDGNFYWKSQIDNLINRLDYPHHVFTLKASLKTCIERDNKRIKTHGKDAAEAIYRKSTSFEYGEVIDTENKTEKEVVEEIKKELK